MKQLMLFTVLIQLLLIPSSASCQVSRLDTSRNYGISELRVIADTLAKCQEYRRLLIVANQQLVNRDFVIKEHEKETRSALTESQLKDKIISGKEAKIAEIELNLKKTKRKLTWTQIEWGSTSAVLLTALGYSLLHR